MLQTRNRGNADSDIKMMSIIEDSEDEKKLSSTEPTVLAVSEVDSDDDNASLGSARDSFPDWQKLVYERLTARDQTIMKAIILNFEKTGIVDLSNINSGFVDSFRSAFLDTRTYLQRKGCIDENKVKEYFGITSMVRILSGRALYEEPICSAELLNKLKQASESPLHSIDLIKPTVLPPYENEIPLVDRITQYGLGDSGSEDKSSDSIEYGSDQLPFLVNEFDLPISGPQSPVKKRNSADAAKEENGSSSKRPRVA
ncbi:HCL433Cp [Eremothecium sinecaudum]|uniref:HCL433Cp n=1 Tax=Eremothecium sinecaudum TaxID=45286 RepID=A0A109UYC9_9SACH|nr:HCL433Cp [Eremothecium sinecaudum]AMD19718.1 HCL433Cp [Eremothecium sinecaudum]